MSGSQGMLSLVPTPIGNLGDITLRALETLRQADAVYAEDTRVTGKLLAAHGISAPLVRLDEALMEARAGEVVERVMRGERIAFCSDAGMPGVSDPGLRLVVAARAVDAPYEVLPGASAAALAYVASGTENPHYYFGAFLPRKAAEQRALFESLQSLDAALVFYESPKRIIATLQTVAEVFPHREVAVCRELTKLHEEALRGPAAEVACILQERADDQGSVKGEIVLVIDGPAEAEAAAAAEDAHARAESLARELADEGLRTKQIAARLVEACGVARNEAYGIAMASSKASASTEGAR